ncbi:MAG: type 4a pilus biogenesis protein PilO [Alteromonadaceae bacterium]|nr:type 4a pilus biogenesis protein PilO [Alteromonadaceae bacterium]
MNIDLSQFDNLERDNIGQWPLIPKITLAIFLAIIVMILGYVMLIQDKLVKLDSVTAEEVTLKRQYKTRYQVAANLELFQAQMVEAQELLTSQLKSLPESLETPGLLDDITFVGTTSGLNFVKIDWQPEISKEIYVELPINIEVVGDYHEFGDFVSKIAGLPRIVTLHDFDISRVKEGESRLILKLQARTYKYREASSK